MNHLATVERLTRNKDGHTNRLQELQYRRRKSQTLQQRQTHRQTDTLALTAIFRGEKMPVAFLVPLVSHLSMDTGLWDHCERRRDGESERREDGGGRSHT